MSTSDDITADEFELAEAALASCDNRQSDACKMLRDECGWTLRQALHVTNLVRAANGARS